MKQEISTLIDLQNIDKEIAGFDKDISDREGELERRESEIAAKESALEQLNERIAAGQRRQRELTAENEEAQVRIKDRQNKMMKVQTSREHQALLKEIEDSKRILKESEERIIEIMEEVEQLKKETEELENLCSGEKKILEQEITNVAKDVKKLNSRKKSVAAKRDKVAVELKSSLLKRYNLLLQRRAGQAIAPVSKQSVCQGCHMTIPAQQFNEIRKGNKIHFCPTCQRFLYFIEEEEAEA